MYTRLSHDTLLAALALVGGEQTHVGPARIGDGDSACIHRPSEQLHDVAGSRPGGRDHRVALAR